MFLFKKKQDKEESSGQETGLGDEEDSRSVAGSSDYGCSSLGYDDMAANKKEQEPSIAKEETKAVRSLKVLVLLFLAAAAAGVGTAVYFYTSNAEQAQFEVQYRSDASKVLEAIGKSLDKTLGAIDAYAVSLVSYAQATNQTWPFVTIPDFAVRTAKTRSLSDALIVLMHPVVMPEERLKWENYSMDMQGWVEESMIVQASDPNYFGPIVIENISEYQYGVIHGDYEDIPYNVTRPMLPQWQNGPCVTGEDYPAFNWDLMSQTSTESLDIVISTGQAVLSEAYMLPDEDNPEEIAEFQDWYEWFLPYMRANETPDEPANDLFYPFVVDSMTENVEANLTTGKVVAMLDVIFYWRDLMRDILPPDTTGIVVVFVNPCNPDFTYRIDGPTPVYLGRGDLHETKFDGLMLESSIHDLDSFSLRGGSYTGVPVNKEYCPFTIKVYPSSQKQAYYQTSNPIIFTAAAVLIFVFTSAVFLLYDYMVERRQKKVLSTAVRSTAIVSSLFPAVVRDRLFPVDEEAPASPTKQTRTFAAVGLANPKNRLKNFLNDGKTLEDMEDETERSTSVSKSAPIAELFPETTVLFADIAGFTAWSSIRDPAQVFTLLETLYGAFDSLAKKRGVFKVETIGDSYVAVCGLPEPRKNHAIVIARFAAGCRDLMKDLTLKLETSLGPDTRDLQLRFGLHSGPVTAGVLRGERSRFQLFGDTVNTASRMESQGIPGRIQCSQKTADLLIKAGKENWLTSREELIECKGKGSMQTYFVEPTSMAPSVFSNSDNAFSERGGEDEHVLDSLYTPISYEKMDRLIDWNLACFEGLLKGILAHRAAMGEDVANLQATSVLDLDFVSDQPRSEIAETVSMPKFDAKLAGRENPQDFQLSDTVKAQLRGYIAVIFHMYRCNAFHNCEHASHVVMATRKLLLRVVNPDVEVSSNTRNKKKLARDVASNLHSSTYGITSDPLTQFAVIFSALIHDVDHPGVTNMQLVSEKSSIASLYKGKSVAEQNSVSIAWDLLMESDYDELRACLFPDKESMRRFRQLVVNAVMATDIFDKDLKAFREERWAKAFADVSERSQGTDEDDTNRKAAIVLEYIIQASDVSHTMQHWNIYTKWNRRLFYEMYAAFKSGRSEKDPSENWYDGELWFFDFYIIPLAKKLKECGVFGVSCDEFLTYAMDNRIEWENKGKMLVYEMKEMADLEYQQARKKRGTQEFVEC